MPPQRSLAKGVRGARRPRADVESMPAPSHRAPSTASIRAAAYHFPPAIRPPHLVVSISALSRAPACTCPAGRSTHATYWRARGCSISGARAATPAPVRPEHSLAHALSVRSCIRASLSASPGRRAGRPGSARVARRGTELRTRRPVHRAIMTEGIRLGAGGPARRRRAARARAGRRRVGRASVRRGPMPRAARRVQDEVPPERPARRPSSGRSYDGNPLLGLSHGARSVYRCRCIAGPVDPSTSSPRAKTLGLVGVKGAQLRACVRARTSMKPQPAAGTIGCPCRGRKAFALAALRSIATSRRPSSMSTASRGTAACSPRAVPSPPSRVRRFARDADALLAAAAACW